jgi:hypothetical protein
MADNGIRLQFRTEELQRGVQWHGGAPRPPTGRGVLWGLAGGVTGPFGATGPGGASWWCSGGCVNDVSPVVGRPNAVRGTGTVPNESLPCLVDSHGLAVANHPEGLLGAARDDVNTTDIVHKANSGWRTWCCAPHERKNNDIALSTLSE